MITVFMQLGIHATNALDINNQSSEREGLIILRFAGSSDSPQGACLSVNLTEVKHWKFTRNSMQGTMRSFDMSIGCLFQMIIGTWRKGYE